MPAEWIKHYENVVKLAFPKLNARFILTLGSVVSLIGIALILTGYYLFGIVILIVGMFIVFTPYKKGKQIVESIEENLGDALREMAAVLRSGGTFEVAIKEVIASEYGELSKQFSLMLKEIEAGKSFIAALNSLSMRIDSDFLRKAVLIITDSLRTGGRVADILDEIAEDIRKTYQIRKERKARVSMQFMFIFVSAAVLGPLIVGMSMGIQLFMMKIGEDMVKSGMQSEEFFKQKVATSEVINNILTLYVLIQAVLAGAVGALIRTGKMVDAMSLVPIMLFLSYMFFTLGKLSVLLLTGACPNALTCMLDLLL